MYARRHGILEGQDVKYVVGPVAEDRQKKWLLEWTDGAYTTVENRRMRDKFPDLLLDWYEEHLRAPMMA